MGDGSEIGISLSYIAQPTPDGLAQAFILGESFIGEEDVCLALGDNIHYGNELMSMLGIAVKNAQLDSKATVFGYHVSNPEHYGVVEFDLQGDVISIEEKPLSPKSNYAVTGLYFYPNDVIEKAKLTTPSVRGELEITSINQSYLSEYRLKVELLGRGYAWLDTGTHASLLEAAHFIEIIEKRQGLKVACLEEIAYLKGYISKQKLIELAQPLAKNQYGQYLLKRVEEGI